MSSVPPPYPGDGQGQQPSMQPMQQPYGQPPQNDHRTQTILIIGLGIIIVLILGIGGVLIARSGDVTTTAAKSTGAGTSTTVADGTDDATSTTAGQAPTGNGNTNAGGGNTNTGGGNSGGGNNGGGNTPTTPAAPAATITSFTTPDDIDCHNGMSQTFTASWTTTNAEKVTISIDGPGVYKTYPANGSDSLPFNCSSSHTFLLTAYSQSGATVTRSITLNPRNVQSSTPSPDDEP